MFGLTNSGGMLTANVPDVCKTPTPPAGPVPIPYPNMAQLTMVDASTACSKVQLSGGMALTVKSKTTISNGDEAGVAGGVASSKNVGEAAFTMGSMKVRLEGKAAVRVNDPTTHNAKNTMGMATAPSQTKVMIG